MKNFNEHKTANCEKRFEDIPITKVKIENTVPYSKHPFRVVENKQLEKLAEDIKENGLINPIIVRRISFDEKYEILSGHRRVAAQKMIGVSETEARIVRLSDTEAADVVIKSNLLQRDKILPSERARIYKLRNECLKKERYCSQSTEWTEMNDEIKKILSNEFNVSKSCIFEYIRLNYLIENILELVDSSKIKVKLAVSLSYFSAHKQKVIYKYFFVDKKGLLNIDVINKMRQYSGDFTEKIIEQTMTEVNMQRNKPEKSVNTLVKKYVKHFKNEQEFVERLEKLIIEYLQNTRCSDKEVDSQ